MSDPVEEKEEGAELVEGEAPGQGAATFMLTATRSLSQEELPDAPVPSGSGGPIAELSGQYDSQESKDLDQSEESGEVNESSSADGTPSKGTRQIFVLSEAGKPVYTRYGREEDWVTLMAAVQALVSFVESRDDSLQAFSYLGWRWIFVPRPPLILVAASSLRESPTQLHQQLHFVYCQILSVLTKTQLTRIFETRKNYDLRRLLTGTEKSLRALTDRSASDPSLLLGSIRSLPILSSVRESIGQSLLSSCNKIKNLVFAFLVARNQLVTMVRMKRYRIHPGDLQLVLNLLDCNPSLKNAESWLPICLPRFDDTGFLHAHISYFADCPDLSLVMLTVDRNAFFTLSEVKAKLAERMKKSKAFPAIVNAVGAKQGVPLSEICVPDLWHFLYKTRASSQLCVSSYEPPYISSEERRRLMEEYLSVIGQMFPNETEPPLRIVFSLGEKEAILGWVTTTFELYAAFSPLVSKQSAISKVDRLMKWLRKEEDRFFIVDKNLILADAN